MNLKQFVLHGIGVRCACAPRQKMSTSELVPHQACSIRELFIRQQQGLPLPPMTSGYVFNGLSIDELPKSSYRYADRSDKAAELSSIQNDLKTKGLKYNIN